MQVPEISKVESKADQPPNLAGEELAGDVDSINESRLDEATTGEPYGEDADSQWWRLSDETVTKVGEHDVLSQGGVFMLFYDCVDPNSVLVTSGATAEEAKEPTKTPPTNTEVHGRESPSWSGNSVATLCNHPTEPPPSKFGSRNHPATLFGILSAE
jgi:hypothetical protein